MIGLINYQTVFPTPATPRWLKPGNVYDQELLHRQKPNFQMFGIKRKGNIASTWCLPGSPPEYEFDVVFDSRGFRNNAEPVQTDIAIIGDSYIEAAGVPMEQSITSHLAESIQTTVINLGHSGYGPQQELIVLKRYALPLKPNRVIWAFYEGNDLRDAAKFDKIKAHLAQHPPSNPSLWKRSFAANALEAVFHQLKSCTPKKDPQYGMFPSGPHSGEKMFFLDGFRPTVQEKGWQQTINVLSEAFKITNAAHIQLIVVFIPTKLRTYRPILNFHTDSRFLDWKANDLPQRLESALAGISSKISFLNLTSFLVAEAKKGKLVYFLDDTHWAPEGHRIAAKALQNFLSSHTPNKFSAAHKKK